MQSTATNDRHNIPGRGAGILVPCHHDGSTQRYGCSEPALMAFGGLGSKALVQYGCCNMYKA